MRPTPCGLALLGSAAVGVAAVGVVAGTAVAHVEPQVSEAPAAGRFTFAFEVEHGCDGSPTVEVAIQMPPGSFDVAAVDKPGWTATVEETEPPVVTFRGGPLAADVADTFAVELVTPDAPGTEALFPTVQVCEVGELAWIEDEAGGDHPAPRVQLLENADPIRSTTTTQAAPSTTTRPTTAPEGDDDADDGDGDGGGGGAVGVGVAAGLGAAALAVWSARRRRL